MHCGWAPAGSGGASIPARGSVWIAVPQVRVPTSSAGCPGAGGGAKSCQHGRKEAEEDDPGVLILSRFAGAARECTSALLVNPYDPEGVGNAINRALSMPLAERRQRHQANFKALAANDLSHWAERFLAALERVPAAEQELPIMRAASSR